MELISNWWEEKRSAYLYTCMAIHESNILNKKLFNDLHDAAEKQAQLWETKMKASGIATPAFKPDVRTRLVACLIGFVGSARLRPILSAMKIRGMSVYTHYHREHQHTSLNSASNLRAAIFGVNDGLISNMSLILGMAGAHSNHGVIILAGTAGLLAGACSMAAGEYISVRSQREVFEYQIALEKQELEEYPEEETEELSLIYQARGIPVGEANKLAQLMISNPETGLNTLAREELGLNPDELVSPIGAMLSSFFSFGIGATLPLLPFLCQNSAHALWISIGVTATTLFFIGALLSLFTNKNPVISGLRMLSVGVIAGFLTYLIGHWVGVSVY